MIKHSKIYESFRLALVMVFWLIELLLFIPDVVVGAYFLFVKHPIKTFFLMAILFLLWYTGIISQYIL